MKTYQGHIVDAVSREIYDGELVVDDGRIVQVNRCELPGDEKQWPYLMPGFIDSHVHIESSMMTVRDPDSSSSSLPSFGHLWQIEDGTDSLPISLGGVSSASLLLECEQNM